MDGRWRPEAARPLARPGRPSGSTGSASVRVSEAYSARLSLTATVTFAHSYAQSYARLSGRRALAHTLGRYRYAKSEPPEARALFCLFIQLLPTLISHRPPFLARITMHICNGDCTHKVLRCNFLTWTFVCWADCAARSPSDVRISARGQDKWFHCLE